MSAPSRAIRSCHRLWRWSLTSDEAHRGECILEHSIAEGIGQQGSELDKGARPVWCFPDGTHHSEGFLEHGLPEFLGKMGDKAHQDERVPCPCGGNEPYDIPFLLRPDDGRDSEDLLEHSTLERLWQQQSEIDHDGRSLPVLRDGACGGERLLEHAVALLVRQQRSKVPKCLAPQYVMVDGAGGLKRLLKHGLPEGVRHRGARSARVLARFQSSWRVRAVASASSSMVRRRGSGKSGASSTRVLARIHASWKPRAVVRASWSTARRRKTGRSGASLARALTSAKQSSAGASARARCTP